MRFFFDNVVDKSRERGSGSPCALGDGCNCEVRGKLHMRSSRTRCRMNLEQKAREDVVLGFGKSASDSLDKYLYEYESEAAYFEEGVRTTKRNLLITRALDTIQPACQSVLAHHRSRALDTFKMSLDTALESDSNEGFADIVRHCSEIVLIEFDRGCAGAIPLPHGSTVCLPSCICGVTYSYFRFTS